MPTAEMCGALLAIYASTHFIHIASRHAGSLPSVSGMSGKQLQPFVPLRRTGGLSPSLAGQSRIVAFPEMDDGAALIALAIFCSLVIALDIDLLIVVCPGIGMVCRPVGLSVDWAPAIREPDSWPMSTIPVRPPNVLRKMCIV